MELLSNKQEMKMKTVILDTNALFIPLLFKIDLNEALYELIDEPFKIIILDVCIKELEEKLDNEKNPRLRNEIKFALAYSRNFEIYNSEEYPEGTDVDTIILREAKRKSAIVVTNDRKLRSRLIKNNIIVISIRGNKRLDFTNPKR